MDDELKATVAASLRKNMPLDRRGVEAIEALTEAVLGLGKDVSALRNCVQTLWEKIDKKSPF